MKLLRPVAATLLLVAAGCSGGGKAAAPSSRPANGQRVDAATAGAIVGRVTFEGTAPENPTVKMQSDPACLRANTDGLKFENYVVRDGGLDNVFVYVKDGLDNYSFDTPSEAVELDQQGCRYVPHVLGVRAGQPVEITNSDDTTHNVHTLPNSNREMNVAQYVKGQKHVHTFNTVEVMVPFKCDLHMWMNAYIGVVDHPYFAVTSDGGKFELKGLPPGTYTVETWHEKAGRQTQQVTIGAKESKEIGFAYRTGNAN